MELKEEDKKLLFQDLCCRLPYGVKVQVTQVPIGLSKDETLTYNIMYSLDESDEYITIKPYLRPMSSMTEEENKEFYCQIYKAKPYSDGKSYNIYEVIGLNIDWLNEHHFDFRNLIEKGLAIAVTKDNNPYKDDL